MQFVSFFAEGRARYGIVHQDGVFDLSSRLGDLLPDLKSLLRARALGLVETFPKVTGVDYARGEFTYAPLLGNPEKILCVGLNYEEHRKETGRPESAYPSIFTRFSDTLIGHETPIILPSVSSALDFEGELAVVIGKPGFRVPEEKATQLVAGYSCFNDVTLRDWQRHTHQFIPGKNFPGTGPFGPELITPDEISSLDDMSIVTRLNGIVMQEAKLGDMIFSIPRVISYVSGFTKLAPGDVIATGTPGGVGFKRNPQLFMKAGDRVEVEVGGVGLLANMVEAEVSEDSAGA
jgi:2-keto-4-pentenoate hydratase/2-oxohepta-3-ene-1,7-dioic acid hydratase in catechol pathway